MPRKDGTGPLGVEGRGQGGRGQMRGPLAAGPGGQCICPSCDYRTDHIAGEPCSEKKCPKCGAILIRG